MGAAAGCEAALDFLFRFHRLAKRTQKIHPGWVTTMGIRLRLNLLITAAAGFSLLLAGTLVIRNYRRAVGVETQASAQLVLGLLNPMLGLPLSPAEAASFQDHLTREIPALTEMRHVRLEVFDRDGKALTSPQGSSDSETNVPHWFLRLVAPRPESHRLLMSEGLGSAGSIVVTTDPDDEAAEEWTNTRDVLLVIGLSFVVLWILVVWYVTHVLRPMDELHEAFEGFGRGQMVRARVFGAPELARINREFNEMAEALEKAGSENHRLTSRLIQLRDDERRGIARELHDNLAQYLFAIRTDAFAIGEGVGKGESALVTAAARSISESASRMETIVREMIRQLRPPVLDELGLADALRDLITTWRLRNPGIKCTLHIEARLDEVSSATSLAIYHVIQESLTNVAKHSRASAAMVTVREVDASGQQSVQVPTENAKLELVVEDNGQVINAAADASGLGLVSMRERVETLGGRLESAYHSGRGWEVIAELPASTSRDHVQVSRENNENPVGR
jgi:two-component system, NarL family, sensor histidine kinase UhpB